MSENITYEHIIVDPNHIILPVFEYDKDAVKGIAASIKSQGLQNLPILKKDLTCIAGKKRVLALLLNGETQTEVKIAPEDITDFQCEMISLDENLCRENLAWYDQVLLQKRRHELRQKEYGVGQRGKKKGWSLRDSAEELDVALGHLSENLRLADAILENPALRKIQDRTTAKRIILTEIKRNIQEQMTGLPTGILNNKIFHGSSEEIIKYFPDKTFDCCITDPPWLEFNDKGLAKDEFTYAVFKELFAKMKDNSFMYMFVSTQDFAIYRPQLEELGWSVQKYPIIWVKEGSLSLGNTSWQYQRNYEPILVAVKGSPALTRDMLSSIYSTKVVHASKMIHPNEKPKEIIKILLEHSTYEGSLVIDPFGGSGVTAESCKDSGRHYITIERDPKYFAGILDRLGEV